MLTQVAEKQKKKELGQYFTPENVVAFMYEMGKLFLPQRKKKYIKIIDPACGEGIFLKYALEHKITARVNIYGCDIDPAIENEWQKLNVLGKLHLYICDGLIDEEENGIKKNSFDLVIGNPPYGGTGLSELASLLQPNTENNGDAKIRKIINLFGEEDKITEKTKENSKFLLNNHTPFSKSEAELIRLVNTLKDSYESWKRRAAKNEFDNEEEAQQYSFESMYNLPPGKERTEYFLKFNKAWKKFANELQLPPKHIKVLINFPIEILFTERFLQLAKPDGLIAIILPEGIFANAQTQYFRDWLLQKGRPLAIVSLPRKVFSSAGANAKTNILFMKKRKSGEILKDTSRKRVLLTSPNQGNGNSVNLDMYFEEVLDAAKKMRK
jgi:type I restriction-modification system DNA methylase subunit